MTKKDSLFDTLIGYLNSLGIEKDFFGQKKIDDLALAHVRFVQERLEECELSQTERMRGSEALNRAYDAVDPTYTGPKLYFTGFGKTISAENEAELRKKPKLPKLASTMPIGDSPADRELEEVAQKIRDRRASVQATR